MTRIRAHTRRAEDWRRLLADPIRHWRVGYSAYELAHAWQSVTDFPPAVAAAFSTASFGELEVLFAFPEHRTSVPGRGFDSATDLFVVARTYAGELVTVAVEGKVAEGFDEPVAKWLSDPRGDDGNRRDRLGGLAELLGLDVPDLGEIAYQLLHRAAVPFLEARRLNAAHAVLLVHSFSADRAHIDEYQALARLFGASGGVGVVESIGSRKGVERHLCCGLRLTS